MKTFQFDIEDWLSSSHIALMDADEERGYLRLLLRAATQPDCGIPDDNSQLAVYSLLGRQWYKPTKDAKKRINGETSGQKLRACFFAREGRLYNERLLREFYRQKHVTEVRSIGGKHAAHVRLERNLSSTQVEHEPNSSEAQVPTNGELSARHDSDVCVCSSSLNTSEETTNKNIFWESKPSARFSEFWSRYPHKVEQDFACQMWISLVTRDNEERVFACLSRYEASDLWARRIYEKPGNWLNTRSKNDWSDAPAAAKERPKSRFQEVLDRA